MSQDTKGRWDKDRSGLKMEGLEPRRLLSVAAIPDADAFEATEHYVDRRAVDPHFVQPQTSPPIQAGPFIQFAPSEIVLVFVAPTSAGANKGGAIKVDRDTPKEELRELNAARDRTEIQAQSTISQSTNAQTSEAVVVSPHSASRVRYGSASGEIVPRIEADISQSDAKLIGERAAATALQSLISSERVFDSHTVSSAVSAVAAGVIGQMVAREMNHWLWPAEALARKAVDLGLAQIARGSRVILDAVPPSSGEPGTANAIKITGDSIRFAARIAHLEPAMTWLSDSLANFVDESASLATTLIRPSSAAQRAWAVTVSMLAVDAAVVGYYVHSNKKQAAKKRLASRPPSQFSMDRPIQWLD